MKRTLERRQWLSGYLFLLPNLLGTVVFVLIPIVGGLLLSFTDYDGFGGFNFIGIRNFAKLFTDSYFTISLKNTLEYVLINVPATLVLSMLLALAVNRLSHCRGFFRTVFYFPNITAALAISLVWKFLFYPSGGPINSILMSLGVQNPPGWIVSSQWSMIAVAIVGTWKGLGYYMILILAGLQSVPRQLYEAADVDGATAWHKFWKITLPMLSPTTFLITILTIIGAFQIFEYSMIMTEGGPGRSSYVLVYRIYVEAFKNRHFGYASAMSVALFLIIFIVTLVQFRGQKKWVTYMQ